MKLSIKQLRNLIRENFEDARVVEPPEEPPYESFEDKQSQYENELSKNKGIFLVFDDDGNGVNVEDNLLDAKQAVRFSNKKIRKLSGGYSEDEFEPGYFTRDDSRTDDDFWDQEVHPQVNI